MNNEQAKRKTYSVAIGNNSDGTQVVSVMDCTGRTHSITPEEADTLADELREAAQFVRDRIRLRRLLAALLLGAARDRLHQ